MPKPSHTFMQSPRQQLAAIRKILGEYEEIHEIVVATGTHPKMTGGLPGVRLGLSDVLMEEVLLLERYPFLREEKVATDQDKRIFEGAAQRARDRVTKGLDFHAESSTGFIKGLQMTVPDPHVGNFTEGTIGAALTAVQSETNFGFAFACGMLSHIESVKGKHYEASWEEDGDEGVMANIKRKYDRLKVVYKPGKTDAGETPAQTLADLAVYCIKALNRRNETHPEEFRAWFEETKALKD